MVVIIIENKKYEFTKNTVEYNGHILHEIKAIKSFGHIKKCHIGGYIESEDNLSQEGNCWVENGCYVYENAKIKDNAYITYNVTIKGNAVISDYAHITGSSIIQDNVIIQNNAVISWCYIYDNVFIGKNARINGAKIKDDVIIVDDVKINGTIHESSFKSTPSIIIEGKSVIERKSCINQITNRTLNITNSTITDDAYIENIDVIIDSRIKGRIENGARIINSIIGNDTYIIVDNNIINSNLSLNKTKIRNSTIINTIMYDDKDDEGLYEINNSYIVNKKYTDKNNCVNSNKFKTDFNTRIKSFGDFIFIEH